jgi:asparagine synthase (glutamine-hydrolysing)
MSGIFATTRLDRWQARVDDVLQALRHRGPDAVGTWMDERAGVLLAHTRLAIVGLGAGGAQPHDLGTSVLSYNGEMYNHASVAKRLGLEVQACDTVTVHEVLQRHGPSGLSLFDGMYALAWWEGAERRMTIARDPWGIKPLYLMRHPGGGITVASELAVFALLRPTVDPLGLAHYVAFGHTTSTNTVYDRVTKLPPGTHLELRFENDRWVERSGAGQRPSQADGDLGTLIRRSVRDQLMADVPVGVFLSGGIDSTLVAATAVRAGAAPHCFTLSFPETPQIDESPIAARNAGRLGVFHTTVPATAELLAARARPLMTSAGEPIADAAALAVDLLSEQASQDVKVVLTGEGSDELFGGYAHHRISHRLMPIRASMIAPLLSRPARIASAKRGDRPWQTAATALLAGGGALGYATLQQAELGVFSQRDDLLRSLIAGLRTDWELAIEEAPRGQAPLAFDQRRWLPNTRLEQIDRATMRHGLEGRVPFLGAGLTAWARQALPLGKDRLARELKLILPNVELSPGKKGLAIDVHSLLRSGLDKQVDRVLFARDSLLREALGDASIPGMRARAQRSASFAYRLATVGIWEEAAGVSA